MGGRLALRLRAVVAAGAGAKHISVIDCTHWRPGTRGVAILADIVGRNMRCILAGRIGAVVARGAVTSHIGVTELCRRPCISAVAIGALGRSLDVRRVFACCLRTVVAAGAGAQHIGVIDCTHWRPGTRGVAILADIVGRNMRCILAGRIGAVVA
jgi:hypothetical protein